LNKSLRICDIRLTTSDIAYRQCCRATLVANANCLGSYICLRQVKDLFNITLAKAKIPRQRHITFSHKAKNITYLT
ncbi:MAG: hypothetical protein J6Q52_02655, partial [Clostridia bacterium]|nr:hypothetical protein [Clostridia bacterium]